MAKIVCFGGDGFIGRHLVAKLAEQPKHKVVVFDRFSSYQIGDDHSFSSYKNITITPGNFFNRSEVAAVLKGADFVFHLISTTNPATSIDEPLIDVETNIKSSVELFELCVENKVKKVIFLSSGGTVYGEVDSDAITETNLAEPISPYAIGKLTIEHYLRYFKRHHDLDYIVYRVANPYGPGQNLHGKQGVVPIFLSHAFNKEPITIFGNGEMVRDYLYISDLVDMITDSFKQDNKYSDYNIGSGKGATINDLVAVIEELAGYKLDKRKAKTPDTYLQKSVLDINRFVKEFKIKPSVPLKEGVAKTWKYVREKQ